MENRTENHLPPTETPSDAPRQEQSGARGFFRKNSLQLAGLLNLIGDASLLGAGYKAKDKLMTLAGGLYTGGALALARYGKPSSERVLRTLSEDTADFLKQKTGGLPQGTELSGIDGQKPNGIVGKAENYLRRHPADAMLGLYTAGAAAMLGSGIATNNKKRIGYGVWSLAVKLASFLMPEQAKADVFEKQETSSNPIRQAINWIKEKPLRLFGYGSLITELLLTASVFEDYKSGDAAKKKGAIFGFVTAGAYIASDILMAVSSKDAANTNGKLSFDEQRKVEAMAAEAIAAQPGAKRGALVEEVAGFLAKRPEIGGSRDAIRKALVTQVEHKGTTQVKSAEAEVAAH